LRDKITSSAQSLVVLASASLDHLVGAQEKRFRDFQAQRLCSFQFQLVPRRKLYREFTWICPPQDAVNVGRTPAGLLHLINSIRDQAAEAGSRARHVWRLARTSWSRPLPRDGHPTKCNIRDQWKDLDVLP